MKKLAIVLLGMLAAVSSFAVFYLPLTTEPIENAILPTLAAAAVGLASGAIIGRHFFVDHGFVAALLSQCCVRMQA